ncbi:MAG: SH3 domain-containing protein [Alistipes sp.]|nr:SH3 domain-containing protein [Alistipes sp.]
MKKLVLALSIFTLALSLSSCDLLGGLKEKFISDSTPKEQQEVAETPAPAPKEVRIYANAYDGFVNVRAQPSAKSAILGKLKNGPDYLVQLGVQGNWTKVKWQNGIGYVNNSVVGYTPWKPVYLGIDGNGIQGVYLGKDCPWGIYLVFSNGKFAKWRMPMGSSDTEIDLYYGTWRFEGMDIIFTTKYVIERDNRFVGSHVGAEVRLPVKSKMIGNYEKQELQEWDGVKYYIPDDHLSLSEAYFAAEKKKVNKLVKLK